MGLSLPHLIVVAVIVLVLFGRGRISEMMGDFGKGIRSFKDGMNEHESGIVPPPPTAQPQIAPPQPTPVRAEGAPAPAPIAAEHVKPGEPAN